MSVLASLETLEAVVATLDVDAPLPESVDDALLDVLRGLERRLPASTGDVPLPPEVARARRLIARVPMARREALYRALGFRLFAIALLPGNEVPKHVWAALLEGTCWIETAPRSQVLCSEANLIALFAEMDAAVIVPLLRDVLVLPVAGFPPPPVNPEYARWWIRKRRCLAASVLTAVATPEAVAELVVGLSVDKDVRAVARDGLVQLAGRDAATRDLVVSALARELEGPKSKPRLHAADTLALLPRGEDIAVIARARLAREKVADIRAVLEGIADESSVTS